MTPAPATVVPELRRLADRYARAADQGDRAAFIALFSEDGVLESPRGRFVGREAIGTVPAFLRERYRGTFHAVLNQLAWTTHEGAAAETYCIARHFLRADDDRPSCYEMTIRYQDVFAIRDGGWLFTHRRLVIDAARTFPLDALNEREAGDDL